MGQVLIEIPQNIFARYRVKDSKVSKQLLDELEPYSEPTRDSDDKRIARKKALEDVFGIWSDRKESAQEIARKIREGNRKVT